jgi:signal peptidase
VARRLLLSDELFPEVDVFRDMDLWAEFHTTLNAIRTDLDHSPKSAITTADEAIHHPEAPVTDDRQMPANATPTRSHARWMTPSSASSVLTALIYSAAAVVVGMSLWATLPRLAGWEPTIIDGGSMEPALRRGDIIMLRDVDAESIAPGAIVTFKDPGGTERLVTHRVVAVEDDGRVRTRGDANQVDDSTLLDPDQLQGRAVLRIPYAGMPVLWARHGDWPELIGMIGVVLAAYVAASRRRPSRAIRTVRSTVHRRFPDAAASIRGARAPGDPIAAAHVGVR